MSLPTPFSSVRKLRVPRGGAVLVALIGAMSIAACGSVERRASVPPAAVMATPSAELEATSAAWQSIPVAMGPTRAAKSKSTRATRPVKAMKTGAGDAAATAVATIATTGATTAAATTTFATPDAKSPDAPKAKRPRPIAPLSAEAQRLLKWIRWSGDHGARPFMVIDKQQARVWVFDGRARLKASAPVLLGLAVGDHTVPGIGDRPLADIRDHERTTPAGRFVVEPGRNLKGEDILWIDYDAAVSMHRVRAMSPSERRLQRLASATPKDNRVSYGCINVAKRFYERVLLPSFGRQHGVAYVLPEVTSLESVFAQNLEPPRSEASARVERTLMEVLAR